MPSRLTPAQLSHINNVNTRTRTLRCCTTTVAVNGHRTSADAGDFLVDFGSKRDKRLLLQDRDHERAKLSPHRYKAPPQESVCCAFSHSRVSACVAGGAVMHAVRRRDPDDAVGSDYSDSDSDLGAGGGSSRLYDSGKVEIQDEFGRTVLVSRK